MRLIDADELLKHSNDHDMISTHLIFNAPTAWPKPGKWIPIEKGERGYSAGDFRCSVCGLPNRCYSITDFCCNCGADMRGGKHENT